MRHAPRRTFVLTPQLTMSHAAGSALPKSGLGDHEAPVLGLRDPRVVLYFVWRPFDNRAADVLHVTDGKVTQAWTLDVDRSFG